MARRCWYTNNTDTAEGCDDFWTNAEAIQMYKDSAKAVLSRKNTITGLTYGQDPTIFAWNLINEGRCDTENCTAADIQVSIHRWCTHLLIVRVHRGEACLQRL